MQTNLINEFTVDSANVRKEGDFLYANYEYRTSHIVNTDGNIKIVPECKKYEFKTNTKIPKVGLMLIGWGGNNGTTLTAVSQFSYLFFINHFFNSNLKSSFFFSFLFLYFIFLGKNRQC